MRSLVAVAIIAALLVLVATVSWGWPGAYALLAFVPGVLIGLPMNYLIETYLSRGKLRTEGVVLSALSVMLGTGATVLALLLMAAVNAPEQVTITRSGVVELPAAKVWTAMKTPVGWAQWDSLVGRLRPSGRADGPMVGRMFTGVMQISAQDVPTHQKITAYEPPKRMSWAIGLPPGTQLHDLTETVELAPAGGAQTTVIYRVRYRLPSVAARAVQIAMMRRAFMSIADASIKQLGKQAKGLDAKMPE